MITAGSDSENSHLVPADRLEVVGVVGEQHERGQAGRADRIALRHGLGRVADRIERIGDVTHRLRQAGHLRDAAGVVGDRTVGIQRHDHAGHGQHGRGGDGDAVQAHARAEDSPSWYAPQIAKHTASTGSAVDFIDTPRPAMMLVAWPVCDAAATRCTGRVFGRGVVLGDDDHRRGQAEADQRAAVQRADVACAGHQLVGDEVERDRRDDAGDDHALVQGVHDLAAFLRGRTKNVPMIEATMEAAPSASG